jgi:hypothetical protein
MQPVDLRDFEKKIILRQIKIEDYEKLVELRTSRRSFSKTSI